MLVLCSRLFCCYAAYGLKLCYMFSSVHILYVDGVIVVVVAVAVSFLSFRIYVSKITNIFYIHI